MDAIPELQALNGDVVEVLVKVLYADDLVTKWLWAVRILFCAGSGRGRLRRRLLLAFLGPKLPAVLELRNAHGFEDGVQHCRAARRGCSRRGFRAACSWQVRGGEGREAAGHFSGEQSLNGDAVESVDRGVQMSLELFAEGLRWWGRKRLAFGNEL